METIASISIVLISIGLVVMFWAVYKSYQIIILSYESQYLTTWKILMILMICFSIGYIGAIIVLIQELYEFIIVFTGLVFLFGAFFVFLIVRTGRLSLIERHYTEIKLKKHSNKLGSLVVKKNIEISQKEEIYQTLLEQSNAILFRLNATNKKFTYIAPQIEKILGFKANFYKDLDDWLKSIHPEDRKRVIQFYETQIEEGKDHDLEYRVIRSDGRIVWIKDVVTVEKKTDHSTFLTGLMIDITIQKTNEALIKKSMEKAEESNQAKSGFLANMSHEIRTPLNSIIGITDLLTETQLSNQQKEYLNQFKKSSEHLLFIVNDILDISKIEAGKLQLDEIDIVVKDLVEDLVVLFSEATQKKNLNLSYLILPEVPKVISADPTRLKQILMNLINNAIKFTKNGDIKIQISYPEPAINKNKPFLTFKIIDTGIGIEASKLKSIFKTFTQADASTTRIFGGTGLGLTICKELIELMGGTIAVESTFGKGSTFSITFPIKISKLQKEKTFTESYKATPSLEKNQKSLKILLAEDNPDNQFLIKAFLNKTQHSLEIVENGQEALNYYKKNKYDLVLMDMQMPVMDGYTATREIRNWENEKKIKHIPIFALTAHGFQESFQKSIEAGCNEHLTKPLRKEILLGHIQKISNKN